jgi:cysteine desulfurase
MQPIYLDNAATTPLCPEVREAMEPWLGEQFGNPSSVHRLGLRARDAVDRARGLLARSIGASSEELTFTGSGTEANNLAVFGLARARAGSGSDVVLGPTEHPSVRQPALALSREGFEVRTARLDAHGALDLAHLEGLLSERTVLVAQMLVCNQFGSIYPVQQLARLVRGRAPNAALHVDAVQALGKLDLRVRELDADTLSLSAHKVRGPKGVGALFVRRGVEVAPLIHGGGQEAGRRSGTENVAGVVGFGEAAARAERTQPETVERLRPLRERLRAGVVELGLAPIEPGLDSQGMQPAILSARVPGAPAEVWLHHLDARGVCVSTGSACQARKQELSPALAAVGLGEQEARQVLRFSLSPQTTLDELEVALAALRDVAAELARL